ncbi:MAG: hypothetical protein ACON3Z_19750 [Bradymonadia bacterium]
MLGHVVIVFLQPLGVRAMWLSALAISFGCSLKEPPYESYPINTGVQDGGCAGQLSERCDMTATSCTEMGCDAATTTDVVEPDLGLDADIGVSVDASRSERTDITECAQYFDCLQMCNLNEDCAADCRMQASVQTVMQFDALIACAIEHCGGRPDAVCLAASCPAEGQACLGASYTPGGDDTCTDVIRCMQEEPRGDDATAACIENGAPASVRLVADYAACATQNQCLDSQCAYENCLDETYLCLIDGMSFGDKPCADVYACLGDCSGDECERCLADASMAAHATIYRDVIICFQLNDCDASTTEACPACAGAVQACLASD